MILPAPRPEPLERLVQVGVICTNWAYLEYLLANAIWWLCDVEPAKGKIMTGKINIQSLIDKAIALCESDEHKDLYKSFVEVSHALRDGKNLIERRNTAIHGVFSSSPNYLGVMVERHKKADTRDRKLYPITELFSIGDELYNINKRLIEAFLLRGINVD